MRANGTATPSGPRSVRKRSKAGSSVQSTTDDTMSAGCIAPQQKQTLEEALATVVSWDSLLGTKAEEEGFKAATLAFLRYLLPSKSQRSPKESMNLPLFVRASQLCVMPPTQRGCRDLSLGSLPSPSKAHALDSSASPAIVLQQQWLAAKLKIAEAEDQSWEGRLLRGDDLLSRNITPAKDLKQRGAQRAVSPDRQATVRKLHAARRLDLEQPPAHKTEAVETGTWPSEQPSSKPPRQPLKPVATHTHRAGWGLAVCLLAAALTLLAVTQARRTVVAEGGRLYQHNPRSEQLNRVTRQVPRRGGPVGLGRTGWIVPGLGKRLGHRHSTHSTYDTILHKVISPDGPSRAPLGGSRPAQALRISTAYGPHAQMSSLGWQWPGSTYEISARSRSGEILQNRHEPAGPPAGLA